MKKNVYCPHCGAKAWRHLMKFSKKRNIYFPQFRCTDCKKCFYESLISANVCPKCERPL